MEEAKQTLLDLLDKVAKEQEYVNHTVDVVELNSGGANITSALYSATLRAKGKSDLNLFAKVALMSDHVRKMTPMKDPFACELYFYTKLQKEFERLEEKHGVLEEHKVRIPKLYGSYDTYLRETLVLDDLNAMGFKTFNRNKSADLEYVTAAIDLMAKFHALSMAYHHDDPEGFQQGSDFLTMDLTRMIAMLPIMQPKMLSNVLKVVNEEHRDKLEKYLSQEPSPFVKMTEMYRSKNRNIVVHGDFKPSNLMHRRRDSMLGLLIAVSVLPMVLAEEEKIPAFAQEFEMTEFLVEGSKLYKERLNGVVNNYVNWGLL